MNAKLALALIRYRSEILEGVKRGWRWLRHANEWRLYHRYKPRLSRRDRKALAIERAALRAAQKGACGADD